VTRNGVDFIAFRWYKITTAKLTNADVRTEDTLEYFCSFKLLLANIVRAPTKSSGLEANLDHTTLESAEALRVNAVLELMFDEKTVR
jgi:hypothetical protein